MRKYYSFICLTVILLSTAIFPQTSVQNIVNQVNQDTLMKFVKELSGVLPVTISGQPYTIVSRHKNNASNDKAAEYIQQSLQRYGLTATLQSFSTTGKNVIGVKTGTQFPNQKYIICAHFDDMPSGSIAPGADDNGSGTAAVIEAARILSQYDFPYTIVFALWDEEEQGLIGSAYYANQASAAGDSILGVVNMDMIAYDANNDNKANLHVRATAQSMDLYNKMVEINLSLGIGIVTVQKTPGSTASDHASFWSKGYSAILLIEDDDNDFNAYYHTVNDKIDHFNQPYFLKMSKLAIGTFANFALNLNLKIVHTPVPTAAYAAPIVAAADLQTGLDVGSGTAAPRLYYRTSSGGGIYSQFSSVTGTPAGRSGGLYNFEIPQQAMGTAVEYYIAAQDVSGSIVVTSPMGGSGVNPPGSTPPQSFHRFYVAQTDVVMLDNANSTNGWTISNNWGLSTTKSVSPPTSFSESPTGQYGNNITATMSKTTAVELGTALGAGLSYSAQWDLESGWDYVQLLISTNNGTVCTPLRAQGMILGSGSFQPNGQPLYNGTKTTWQNEFVDLSAYTGQNIMLRFLFKSDGSQTADGFYVDDIQIFKYTAVPVELMSFTATANNDVVNLEWTTATETNNYGFDVEKMNSSGEFSSIGFVKGTGNSTSQVAYSFTDKNAGSGVLTYRLKQTDFDGSVTIFNVVEVDVNPVFNYSLDQNYPNPFNPVSILQFSIADAGSVLLELFDVQGTKIKTLMNETKPAGRHSYQINGSGLSSGTYLVRLTAGKFSATRKIILLK
ncbi:MAG: M28 family peptidase [Ignavibacteriaceae bacterium]|nr:M28 family peptidase [Ignavibacteriaceae bacterium]